MNAYFAEYRLAREIEQQQAQGAVQFSKWLRCFFKFFGTIK